MHRCVCLWMVILGAFIHMCVLPCVIFLVMFVIFFFVYVALCIDNFFYFFCKVTISMV